MKLKHVTLLAFSFCLLLTSCATVELTDRQEEIIPFGIDFRKYSDEGFLFMPDEYSGEYEVKGMITVEQHPEVRYHRGVSKSKVSGYSTHTFFVNQATITKVTVRPNIDDLFDHIYELSLEWGGDAFTHFESSVKISYTDSPNLNTSYPYYSISGIVIKRSP